jgi:hypothetical protein
MLNLAVFYTDNEKNYEICSRIARRLDIPLLSVYVYTPEYNPIVYGLFRDTDRVMRTAYWANKTFYYVDHGYFHFSHYDGYYRIVRNAMFHKPGYSQFDITFKELGVIFNPMKPIGKGVGRAIICAPNLEGSMFFPFIKLWPEEWVNGVKAYLHSIGHDNIIVSTKHIGNRLTDMDLSAVELIVSHDSNAFVYALKQGIPAMNISHENRYHISDDETRQKYFNYLALNQYRLKDISKHVFTF